MELFKITFKPDDVTIDASPGENLLDVAARANLHINASCGGEGVCGRCRVELVEGQLDSEPGLYLSPEQYDAGQRLACRAKVSGPAVINIPIKSRADSSLFTRQTAVAAEENTVAALAPMLRRLTISLEEPSHDDNRSDYDRLMMVLKMEHNLVPQEMDLNVLRKLPGILRENGFKLDVYIYLESAFDEGSVPKIRIVDVKAHDPQKPPLALAIDIGTTTVWGRLVNLETGDSQLSFGDLNGQISFGEDVISRIVYAGKDNGLERMQERVVANINGIIARMEEAYPGCRQQIGLLVCAGNTTMSHLFMALDPKPIRLAPYVPVAASWPSALCGQVGLDLNPATVLLNHPSVSSYVGGDIVSGVLASGLYQSQEITLFIDVGTNGEIVVGNEDWMTCAACSAGPAFEGGGVKFGMRAAAGAVEQFYFDQDTKKHLLTVIDHAKPIGICGSGLINIVAELFKAGVIDPQGKFNAENALPGLVREGEDGWEFLLSPKSENGIDEDLVITEIDVENLIRAKGAMFSGYQTLLEGVGLGLSDLSRVIIAGGFGRSLNILNAMIIGLLPELPAECFSYIGNGSLTGATLAALSGEKWQDAIRIKNSMTNFELSETPGYMDYYMASQFLPHTQKELFAKTLDLIKK